MAGGRWGSGVRGGARAVGCGGSPWAVAAGGGARGACDLVKALQAQSIYGTLARIKGKARMLNNL